MPSSALGSPPSAAAAAAVAARDANAVLATAAVQLGPSTESASTRNSSREIARPRSSRPHEARTASTATRAVPNELISVLGSQRR